MLALGWAQGCGSDVPWPMPTHPSCSSQVHSSLHSNLMPSSLLGFVFLRQDLSPLCLFLLAILRETGGEQPSSSLRSHCFFVRRQIAEGSSSKKKLSLNGKVPNKRIKPRGAQVEETCRENLGCVRNRQWLITRSIALLLMMGIFVFPGFWLFNIVSSFRQGVVVMVHTKKKMNQDLQDHNFFLLLLRCWFSFDLQSSVLRQFILSGAFVALHDSAQLWVVLK